MSSNIEAQSKIVSLRCERLWGASEIAAFLGVSVETVYAWAADPAVPIYKPGSRYFAIKSELRDWLRSKPRETPSFPDLHQ